MKKFEEEKFDIKKMFEAEEKPSYKPSYAVLNSIYEKILSSCASSVEGISKGIKDRSYQRDNVRYTKKGLSINLKSDYNSRSSYSINCKVENTKSKEIFQVNLSTYNKAYKTENGFSKSGKEDEEIKDKSNLSNAASSFESFVNKVISENGLTEADLQDNGNSAANYSEYRIIAKNSFNKCSDIPQWLKSVKEKSGDDSLAEISIDGKNPDTNKTLKIYCSIGLNSTRIYYSKDSFSLKYKDFENKSKFEDEIKSKISELIKKAVSENKE